MPSAGLIFTIVAILSEPTHHQKGVVKGAEVTIIEDN